MPSLIKSFRWKIAQQAELRWWKFYLSKKQVHDYLQWKKQYWKTFLSTLQLSKLTQENTTILDAGCGPAGVFMMFDTAIVLAVDPLIVEYEKKLNHFNRAMYPHVVFKNVSIESLDESSTFNYVFCLNAINHVDQLDLCINKLVKALSNDGTLVVSIDAHNFSLLKHLFRLLPGDILHPHQYSLMEYQNMLTDRGLKITQVHCLKREMIFNYFVLVAKKRDAII